MRKTTDIFVHGVAERKAGRHALIATTYVSWCLSEDSPVGVDIAKKVSSAQKRPSAITLNVIAVLAGSWGSSS